MGWLRDLFGRSGSASTAPAAVPAVAAPAPAWRKMGNEALAAGDLAEAARCYEQGVLAEPQDAALRLNHGFVLLQQEQFAPAAQRLQEALALRRPGDGCEAHDAYFLLARAQASLGEQAQALASFEAAARAQPDFAEPHEEAARILHMLGRHEEAVEWVRKLLRLRPSNFHRILLATELRACGRHAEALEIAEPVCAEEPGNVDAYVVRYSSLMALGRYEEALAQADRWLALHGPSARCLVHRSVPLERLGRLQEALASLEQALALAPEYRDAVVNRCTVLISLQRAAEAAAVAEEALKRSPDDPELHWSLSVALLTLGDMKRGFAESEWRARSAHFRGKLLELEEPRWHGESLQGRTIFLFGEQGFGDSVQFLRLVPQVAALADTVYLLVPEALEPLVERTLPANCHLVRQNARMPAVDFQCPLMSLPAVLGLDEHSMPAQVPYLRADPAAVAAWRERLGGNGPKVGIAWSGNPRQANDHNRSMTLATFRALEVPGCRFFTVQPEMREVDRPVFAEWGRAEDVGRTLRNFDDTAALLEALDVVVTVDTGVAHLAGALGRPLWVLVCNVPDWRWELERADSPWYPTARLYRQPQGGDWSSALARVRDDLAALAARH